LPSIFPPRALLVYDMQVGICKPVESEMTIARAGEVVAARTHCWDTNHLVAVSVAS
jgi:nicotinamidase-related amidase